MNQFVWMLARTGEDGKEHVFILYSIQDLKIVYKKIFKPRADVSNVIFDQVQNIVYMIGVVYYFFQ